MIKTEEDTVFHHALKVVPELCTGCTHCIKSCPTEAIRVRNGLAEIFEDRCVDCGECYKSCPVSAIIIEQDDFAEIFNFKARVALLPSVLIGQFPSHIKNGEIFGSLKKLGFTHIVEIDSVVDIVQEGYDSFMDKAENDGPHISTFCPAVVRLIQVKFPSLVKSLIKVKPPSDIAAFHFKRKIEDEGFKSEEIGLFYVTPCAAKIASVKSPEGDEKLVIHGVINMEYLYNRMLRLIVNNELNSELEASGDLTPKGILWSLTRGESNFQKGRCLAIDGIANVTHFLEKLEESEDQNFDFLELRACDESCAGGVLISGNRFLTVERLNGRAGRCKSSNSIADPECSYISEKYDMGEIKAQSMLVLDDDRAVAIEKIKKIEDLLKVLPGIDCAACGSPTCRSLSEDIVQNRAQLTWCVFLQELYLNSNRITLEEIDRINSGIWGSQRNFKSQII